MGGKLSSEWCAAGGECRSKRTGQVSTAIVTVGVAYVLGGPGRSRCRRARLFATPDADVLVGAEVNRLALSFCLGFTW